MDNTGISTPHSSKSSGTGSSDENMSPTIATPEVGNETPSNVSVPCSTIVTGTLANVTNLSAIELRSRRDREVYASLSAEEKEAKLEKNRDYRQRKKEAATSRTKVYASLSAEEKEAKLQKNRDYRQRKKEATTSLTGTLGDITNLTPVELTRKRARERYASLSAVKKEARLQQMRECYQQKKRERSVHLL
uniref:Uncharacterized protein n=1 Tax=Oryza rufipogon TaxID=4529 RepID=A0A0E0RAS3_ORYRU